MASQQNQAFTSEEILNILSHSKDATAVYQSENLVIQFANQKMLEFWDKNREIIGMTLEDAVPELKGQPFSDLLREVWRSGIDNSGKNAQAKRYVNGELTHFYFDYHYHALKNDKGEVYCILHTATDVTETVRQQKLIDDAKKLQIVLNEELAQRTEMEFLLRAALSSAPFPFAIYQGREMKVIVANQALIDIWGKGPDVIGKTYYEALPELEEQDIFPILDGVFTSGKAYNARNQRVDLEINGILKTFWFNYSFTPLLDSKGEIFGVINTAADVSDIVLAKQLAEKSEQTLHEMILQAPVAMVMMEGPKHIIKVANDLMTDLWGRKNDATILNKPLFEALPEVSNQGLEEMLHSVYVKGETVYASEREVSYLKNGKIQLVYQNYVCQPYKNIDGEIEGAFAVTIDVTPQVLARKKIEESEALLMRGKENLERQLESEKTLQVKKDSFIGVASHELKTPLTSLTAILQLLQRKFHATDDTFVINALNKGEIQAKRMTSLINGFLNISRLEAGKMHVNPLPFFIDQMIRDVSSEMQMVIPTHNILVEINEHLEVLGDHDKLTAVLSNLLNNAAKYSPEGKSISIRSYREENFAKIVVKDQGIGIETKDLEYVFDRYYRVESKNTQHISGFGIGLYVSAEIIREHGGTIGAESEIDKGSTFHFTVPLKD